MEYITVFPRFDKNKFSPFQALFVLIITTPSPSPRIMFIRCLFYISHFPIRRVILRLFIIDENMPTSWRVSSVEREAKSYTFISIHVPPLFSPQTIIYSAGVRNVIYLLLCYTVAICCKKEGLLRKALIGIIKLLYLGAR